jgi:hypothetical protein
MVNNWYLTSLSTIIKYLRRENGVWYQKTLVLSPEESARELSAISSIDSWYADPNITLHYDDTDYTWEGFIKYFNICQWEALTLAIRYEMKLETEKEIENSNIGKAINDIIRYI